MDKTLCPNCQINEAVAPHTCPYDDEMRSYDKSEEEESLCECCAECEYKCMMDI